MTSLTDTDFVPRLPIWIGDTEGFYLSATLTGVQFGRPMSPQLASEWKWRVRQV
jgi:bifunctional DNase/RNase